MADVTELPGAVVEETFWPDELHVVQNDDGSMHLLMYAGRAEGGYLILKHAILDRDQVALLTTPIQAPATTAPIPPPTRFSGVGAGPRQPLVDDDLLV